jgi:hypothetical protein
VKICDILKLVTLINLYRQPCCILYVVICFSMKSLVMVGILLAVACGQVPVDIIAEDSVEDVRQGEQEIANNMA